MDLGSCRGDHQKRSRVGRVALSTCCGDVQRVHEKRGCRRTEHIEVLTAWPNATENVFEGAAKQYVF